MNGGHLQALLFMLNRPEPIRQSSLLMVLATGIGHAPSLMAGLKALSEESSAPWSSKVEQLRHLLAQGQTLSEALTIATGLLPEQSVVAIRVAEQAGSLKQVLADEAHRLMQSETQGNAVQPGFAMTITWLSVIALQTFLIVNFIMVSIIPEFKAIFEGFGVELPGLTILLISLSDWFMSYWYILLLPGVCVAGYVLFMTLKGSLKRLQYGHVMWSEHFPRFWTPLILRLLSITVTAEKSLGDGVHAILKELQPGRAARALSGVRQRINAGSDCWQSLCDQGFLNRRELAFLESSARTRHLDWGLLHLARSVEHRRGRWLTLIGQVLQPVIVLAIGLIVGFIVIALFLPLIKMLNDLS
jgi:type II secretory pathway component PulF